MGADFFMVRKKRCGFFLMRNKKGADNFGAEGPRVRVRKVLVPKKRTKYWKNLTFLFYSFHMYPCVTQVA